MKKILYTTLSVLMLFSLSSCDDWLDINSNPDSPTTEYPTPAQYAVVILDRYINAQETANVRTGYLSQSIVRRNGGVYDDNIVAWRTSRPSTVWCYQVWFVQCASSIEPMIKNAEKEGAWHYVGLGKLIRAMGFMLMLDVYGEMPYTEALQNYATPKFDDGKTIFYGCLEELEEAIEYFKKTQEPGATPLSEGDWWVNGDVNKWIKACYGLKARWLNNLSKKSFYDPDAVLTALSNAAQSNAESLVIKYQHSKDNVNTTYQNIRHGWISNTNQYISKFYFNLLDNNFTGGSGVEDPRLDRLVPSAMFKDAVTGKLGYIRTKPIDLSTNIRVGYRPYRFNVTYTKKDINGATFSDGKAHNIWYNSGVYPGSGSEHGQGDSLYITIYSEYMGWVDSDDDDRYIAGNYYGAGGANNSLDFTDEDRAEAMKWVKSTGTFYTRADAPVHFIAYPEMCFIKAEAYFRKGDKGAALQAYRDGIRAHMELMNEKLNEYVASNDPALKADPTITGSPHSGKKPISDAEIATFLSSAAVAQTAGELTMRHIMQQKFIVTSPLIQSWNDMRRLNYSAGNIADYGVVYPGIVRPYESDPLSHDYFANNTDPTNERYWPRRHPMSSIETDYNRPNAEAVNPEVMENKVQSLPVWWDTVE